MKKMKYLIFILAMVLVLAACGSKESEENDTTGDEITTGEATKPTETTEPIQLFGTFESQTLEGEEVTEAIFSEADLTMVNIWGTFCGPCIAEMPDLGEISREYKEKGFQIVGILCDVMEPGDETALEIINETKADYRHLIASDDLTNNVLQYVSAVPTTAFVDKDGNMVGEIYSGSRSKEDWMLIIDQLLAEVQ